MSTTTDRAGPEDLSEAEQVAIALGRDDQVSRKAALDLIQDLRHRAASTFTPAYSGSLGQARCDSFFEAYEALRLMPRATGEAPASTPDADVVDTASSLAASIMALDWGKLWRNDPTVEAFEAESDRLHGQVQSLIEEGLRHLLPRTEAPAAPDIDLPLAEQAKHHGRDWAVWWQGSTTGPSGERGDHIMELRQSGIGYARELAFIGAYYHEQAGALVAEHNEQMRRLREVIARQAAAKSLLQKRVAELEAAALVKPTAPAQGGVTEGYWLAPVILPRVMKDAVGRMVDDFSRDHARLFTVDIWNTLRATAPHQPATEAAPSPAGMVEEALKGAMRPFLDERDRWADSRFPYGDERHAYFTLGNLRRLCKAYEALLAHPQEVPAPDQGWQPIKMAPGDGAPVLVGWSGTGFEATKAHCENGIWGTLDPDMTFWPMIQQPDVFRELPISPDALPTPPASTEA